MVIKVVGTKVVPQVWYSKYVGATFEVEDKGDFYQVDQGLLFYKEDCEVVPDIVTTNEDANE